MLTYEEFVQQECLRILADGCTGVSEWNHECCLEHDLACRYGRDPRDAYRRYRLHTVGLFIDPWVHAQKMSRRKADYAFLRCNRCAAARDNDGPKKLIYKLRAWGRFTGVRIGALLGIGIRK